MAATDSNTDGNPKRAAHDPRRAAIGVWLSIAAVLAADLPWGDFHAHTHWQAVGWIPFVSPPVRLGDILQNVVLFVPLGFFAGIRWQSLRAALLKGLALAFAASFIGEWSQLYSHSRFASATDMASNLIGAGLGAGFAWLISRHTQPVALGRGGAGTAATGMRKSGGCKS